MLKIKHMILNVYLYYMYIQCSMTIIIINVGSHVFVVTSMIIIGFVSGVCVYIYMCTCTNPSVVVLITSVYVTCVSEANDLKG